MDKKYYFITYVTQCGSFPEVTHNNVVNEHPLVWQINKNTIRQAAIDDAERLHYGNVPARIVLTNWFEITQAEYGIIKFNQPTNSTNKA